MTVTQQYNALPTYGKVSREQIQKLIDEARQFDIILVVEKLTKLLNQLPDTNFFNIEIANPLSEPQLSLGGLANPAVSGRVSFSRAKNKFKSARDAWRSIADETGAIPQFAKRKHTKNEWIWEIEKFNIKKGLSGTDIEQGLSGVKEQKEGLNQCGFLEKGYKFEKGGIIVKTKPKIKTKKETIKPIPKPKEKTDKSTKQVLPAPPPNTAKIEILKTSPKGAMLITDGEKTVWIQKRGQRADGSFTPGTIQKLKESQTTLREFKETGKTSNVIAANEVRFDLIVKETEKAVLIRSFNGQEDWIPKVAIIKQGNSTKSDSFFVATWALKGKNLQFRNKVKFFPRTAGLGLPGQDQIFAAAKDGNNFTAAAPGYFDDLFFTEKQADEQATKTESSKLKDILAIIKEAIFMAKSLGLAGSWHARNTIQFFALDDCGRLRPSYIYEKGGEIKKVKKNNKIKKIVRPKKKSKINKLPLLGSIQNKVNTNIITGKELLNMTFEIMPDPGAFDQVLSNAPQNIRIGVYGLPKHGKTSACTELAKEFAKMGKVLYNFADQGIIKSTKDIWINSGLIDTENAHLTGITDLDELIKTIKKGQYHFVFIDMINNYIAKSKITPHEFKTKILDCFPEVSFILVMETTKTGNFKGNQAWMHIVDQIFEIKDFVIHSSGRYGFGHLVIWPEGLEKNNSKKFAELMQEPEPEIITEEITI